MDVHVNWLAAPLAMAPSMIVGMIWYAQKGFLEPNGWNWLA